jgi:hypothetical protein
MGRIGGWRLWSWGLRGRSGLRGRFRELFLYSLDERSSLNRETIGNLESGVETKTYWRIFELYYYTSHGYARDMIQFPFQDLKRRLAMLICHNYSSCFYSSAKLLHEMEHILQPVGILFRSPD